MASEKTAWPKTDDSRTDGSFVDLLDQILQSEAFRSAPVLRALLLYLCRNQGKSVSEYAIGVDVLGRQPDFDPKWDATVRVAVARLRKKLTDVYRRELKWAPFQLTVPLGGHEINWVQRPQASSLVSAIQARPLLYKNVLLVSIALGIVLAALCLTLGLENGTLRASLPPHRTESRLWRSFLAGGNGKNPLIVVPSPLFFQWSDSDNGVYIRDHSVSQFQDWTTSPVMAQMAREWGPPKLAETFTPIGALKSAAKIMQYLESLGQYPALIDSLSLSVDAANAQNTILLQVGSSDRVKQIMKRTNFYFERTQPTVIINRNPRPGEASEYREVEFSTEHKIMPELIVLSPPETSNGTRSLFLLGPNPAVFTSILLLPEGLKLVEQELDRAGFPDSWEMLIQAETNGETVLKLQPLAIRGIIASSLK